VSERTGTAGRRTTGIDAEPDRAGDFFAALGRMVVRHPWRVIALWVIAAGGT